jgi:cytochrome P450
MVQQQSLNSPKVWDAPHKFRPERFENVRDLRPTEPVGVPGNDSLAYGFVPFGAGLRTCVGQRLAMLEGVQIIASICKAFDLELMVAPDQLDVVSDVTLGPKHGLPLRITRRGVGQAQCA